MIATQLEDDDGWEWKSAKAAAARYVELGERVPGVLKGFDYARAGKGGGSSPAPASHVPASLLALDERRELREVFAHGRAELDLARPEVASRWWTCWWAVRIEGESPKCRVSTGYGKSQAFEVLREVDAYVLIAMESRQSRESLSEEFEARINAGVRPRVGYAQAAVMPWEEEDHDQV